MWDQDNYLWPWLHDLTPAPGSDTGLPTFQSADPTFRQLLQHNDNVADVGKCLSASHCVAEWRRVCVITAAMIQPAVLWSVRGLTSCLES